MKVYIEHDEWYPVYSLLTPDEWRELGGICDGSIEIVDEFYKRWKAADTEFQAVQELLGDLED